MDYKGLEELLVKSLGAKNEPYISVILTLDNIDDIIRKHFVELCKKASFTNDAVVAAEESLYRTIPANVFDE